jgi:hypothetical protein
VLNSLRADESIRRPQNLGFRFRGGSTFEGSYPLDPDWIKKAIWLANLPARSVWTGSSYWLPWHRAIAGSSHFLRAPTDIATIVCGYFCFPSGD